MPLGVADCGRMVSMTVETVSKFFALLTLAAMAGVLGVLVVLLAVEWTVRRSRGMI